MIPHLRHALTACNGSVAMRCSYIVWSGPGSVSALFRPAYFRGSSLFGNFRFALRFASASIFRAPSLRRSVSVSGRSEEHTSELQSLMRISYAVFCLKQKPLKLKHHEHLTRKNIL